MKIEMIAASKLYHHPNNPRNDYGDLEELASSIRGMGVLQNLTVVPYNPSVHQMPSDTPTDAYLVIIGNRRLEAAKQVGLQALPCVIDADMSFSDQLASMLAENNLRESANPLREAQNIQLMLDWGGCSIDQVAEKTGFSASKVRSRLKLCSYNQETANAALEKGATLSDFAELNKLKSQERRDAVLEVYGTKEFRYRLEQARSAEKNEAKIAQWVDEAKSSLHIEQLRDDADLDNYVRVATADKSPLKMELPEDVALYFFLRRNYIGHLEIVFYRQKVESDATDNQADEKLRQHLQLREEALEEIKEVARASRLRFVKNLSSTAVEAKWPAIAKYIGLTQLYHFGGYSPSYKDLGILLGINIDVEKTAAYDNFAQLASFMDTDSGFAERLTKSPTLVIFYEAFVILERFASHYNNSGYYKKPYFSYATFRVCPKMDTLYKLLNELGYEESSEEAAWRDGTHQMYLTEESFVELARKFSVLPPAEEESAEAAS